MFIKANRITVLISGMCALILSMGIARYSFTPMIPPMQAQTGMTDMLSGLLVAFNYAGFLAGLLAVWMLGHLQAKDFFYRYALLVLVIITAAMAASDHPLVWFASRLVAGVATAASFILGTGLILNWLNQNGYKPELGIHFAGIGAGLLLSGLIVEAISTCDVLPEILKNWRVYWVVLAAVAALLLLPAALLLPRPIEGEREISRGQSVSAKWTLGMLVAFFCAGFGNTFNITFASLITGAQATPGWNTDMWVVIGLAAIPAPFIWDLIARMTGRMNALRIAFVLSILGHVALALAESSQASTAAVAMFGFTFMGVISLTLSTVGDIYGERATNIMALLALVYCLGQLISAVISSIIAEQGGSSTMPLITINAVMAVGLVCLMIISDKDRQAQA